MIYKTAGITLHRLPYNDQYGIVLIFTELFGKIAYRIPTSSGKKSGSRKVLFHPLSLLELEVEHLPSREIHRIKEVKAMIPLPGLWSDPVKSTICIFLSEFISHVSKEGLPHPPLFDFIQQSVQILNYLERGIANFHLVFMIQISRFLGFYPNTGEFSKSAFFDMMEGHYVSYNKNPLQTLTKDESQFLPLLLRMNYDNLFVFRFSRHDRVRIIKRIIQYYRLHLTDFPELKSLDVLHAVFSAP